MKKILLLIIYLSLIINIISQKKKSQKKNNNNNIKNNSNNNINNNNKKVKEKEFNLTEKVENYFSNRTNDSKNKNEESQEDKIEIIQQTKKIEKDDEELNKLKIEKEQFDKQIEIFSLSDFTTLELPGKKEEIIYYKVTTPCTIKFAFYLSDSEKLIDMNLLGPDHSGNSQNLLILKKKNFLYHEYKVTLPGMYTFHLNNYLNSDLTEISFAVKNDLKVDGNIGKQKLDTISEYLNEIDEKINKMRTKQNIVNKKTEAYNDSVNNHNKEILIYSIAEVGTMVLIFIGQLFYIKSKVDKI
jgi:hypothetical protein